jgi:Domain of unknown function (DUF4342)
MPTEVDTRRQRVLVRGEELLAKAREVVHQGNVRRIIVIGENGDTILEIPLTLGVAGALAAPSLVALGAIAALAKNYTLLIESTQEQQSTAKPAGPSKGAEPEATDAPTRG